jgi:hypothetical protein
LLILPYDKKKCIGVIIFNISFQIDNLYLGLFISGLLALLVPFITKQFRELKILNIEYFDDPATFFIIWQMVIGLAIAFSIWIKTYKSKTNFDEG